MVSASKTQSTPLHQPYLLPNHPAPSGEKPRINQVGLPTTSRRKAAIGTG